MPLAINVRRVAALIDAYKFTNIYQPASLSPATVFKPELAQN
jgi:hypothetical protein